jgi:ubiquinone/menaquinone biosynthesis C-methylase UbiE
MRTKTSSPQAASLRDMKPASAPSRGRLLDHAVSDVTVASVLRKFADLRQAVSGLARFLRSEGVPPEQMLPHVKSAVIDIIVSEGWKDRNVQQLVVENVVRWAIDAYYDQ